jgi:hypothetical protein
VTVRALPLDLAVADAPTRLAKTLSDEGPGPTKTPMNTRGTRSAEAVATTVVRALSGNGPAVIDGKANALTTFLFGRLLPTRLTLAVARRMMMARSGV